MTRAYDIYVEDKSGKEYLETRFEIDSQLNMEAFKKHLIEEESYPNNIVLEEVDL
jgi:hypothetical protein